MPAAGGANRRLATRPGLCPVPHMKSRLSIVIAAALLTPGCEKQKESRPARVVQPATADNDTRRSSVPGPPVPVEEPVVPADPPAPEEVDAFLTDLNQLAEEVQQLPGDAAQVPNVDALQKSYSELIQRRNGLAARMNEEQKVTLAREVAPRAKVIGPALMRLRLAKAREQMKSRQPANPGAPQGDTSLGDFIPGLNGPEAATPPPVKEQTVPPQ